MAAVARDLEGMRRSAEEALAAQKYFDGVQGVNAVMEAYEERLVAERADFPRIEKLEILRMPEAFLQKAMPLLPQGQKEELAQLYALRAKLLAGLGAQKRAILDLSAALALTPEDPALVKLKQEYEERDAAGVQVAESKTPTTIITGFLGAGKTTLLNHILTEEHGKRVAVIENEFGEVGIDDKLLNTKSTVTEENVIEMNNGCVCCTVRGDLIAGLKKLHKQTTGKGKPLDYILIETTGLANPSPVAQTFFADDFVNSHMTLDGILTVVDAKHILQHLREEKPEGIVNESVEQVAFADRILLNKTDLVTDEYLEEVQSEIRRVNRTAQIRRTQNAKVDMDFLLGIKAFSLDKVLEEVSGGFLDEEEFGHGHGHAHGGEHGGAHVEGHGGHDCDGCSDPSHGHGAADAAGQGHGHGHVPAEGSQPSTKKKGHVHDYRVTSVGIERDAEVHKERLDQFISWLMQQKGQDLYRSKGVLAVKGSPSKFVFHAVHMQYGGRQQDNWEEGEKRCCKMVFIGKGLNREELNKRFDECLAR